MEVSPSRMASSLSPGVQKEGFVEHADIQGLEITVTTVDFLRLETREADCDYMRSEKRCEEHRGGGVEEQGSVT